MNVTGRGIVVVLSLALLWYLIASRHVCILRSHLKPVAWPAKMDIPRQVWRTTHLPLTVVPDLFGNQADEWEMKQILDDAGCEAYLSAYFPPRVVQSFRMLHGAHKADLWRYAVLWREGGFYCDIKSVPWVTLNSIASRAEGDLERYGWYTVVGKDKRSIFNGIIATPPHNPIILAALDDACYWLTRKGCDYNYLRLVQELGRLCKDVYGGTILKHGASGNTAATSVLILDQEACSSQECSIEDRVGGTARDRYGLCCNAYDEAGNQTWQIRDPTYPWS